MMRFMYLLVAMVWLVFAQAQAQFIDTQASPYGQSIANLAKTGVVKGYDDNTFRPDQPINRAEFLKILLETKYQNQVNVYRKGRNTCFSDLPSSDLWYKPYACVGKDRKIIQGFPDGSFRGAAIVNKAQAAKIFYNVYFEPLTVETKPWYQGYYNQLKLKNIFLTIFNGSPNDPLTRGEMAFAIDQFEVYPSHQLTPPSVKIDLTASSEAPRISSEAPIIVNEKTPAPTRAEITAPTNSSQLPSTSTKISPEYVVLTTHPKTKIGGSYISSWDQWIQARYSPSAANFKTSERDQYLLAGQVLQTVNDKRQSVGVSTMRQDAKLQALAQNFATHLVINAFYSHSDKLGRNPIERAELAGINGWVAESIVWRNQDPLKAVNWWQKSAIHWKSVGSSRYKRAGVGIAKEPNGGYIVVLLQGE